MPEDTKNEIMKKYVSKMTTGEVGRPEDVAESYLLVFTILRWAYADQLCRYAMRDWNVSGSVISTNGGSLLK